MEIQPLTPTVRCAPLEPSAELIEIPFEGKKIVGYLRLPRRPGPHPLLISIGGLDQYKEFSALTLEALVLERGISFFAVDMPGTGEAPVSLDIGAERMYSKLIDVLSARSDLDPKRIAVFGASAGGYWSALLAQVEQARLKAAVVMGAPIDHYFDADWQRNPGARRSIFSASATPGCLSMAPKRKKNFSQKCRPFL